MIARRWPWLLVLTYLLVSILLAMLLLWVRGDDDAGKKHPPALIPAVFINRNLTVSQSRCQTASTGCAGLLLRIINQDRQAHGAGPLTLDWTDVHGIAGQCAGASGHSKAMRDSNAIWHVGPDPTNPNAAVSFPNNVCTEGLGFVSTEGQNVAATPGTKYESMLEAQQLMLSEPWTPGCQDNHACNLRYSGYSRIGIAWATDGSYWYLTEDFIG